MATTWTKDTATKATGTSVTTSTVIDIADGQSLNFRDADNNNIITFPESGTGTVVFNEQGTAMDFRVEGDNDTHTLFVDGSTDRVGINVSDPDSKLEILEATDNQLKLSYDASNATTFNTGSGGDLTIVPSGGDANVTGNLAVSGDLTITGDDLFMNTNTSGYVLVADGTNYNPVAISGDVTLNSAGAITIAANAVEGSMLNTNVISGQTEMTGDVADADELLVSDAGTVKRADFSVVRDAVFSDVSGDATVASGGALTIANDAVEQAMIADDAVGADQLASNAVVNASIASGAAIDMDKLDGDSLGTAITDFAQDDLMVLSDTSDSGNLVKMTTSNFEDAIFGNVSGDATIAAGGALTIAADSVEGTMLNTNAADTSTIELSSDTLSVLKVPNALTAGDGISAAGTFDGAASRTFALDLNGLSAATVSVANDSIAIIDADGSNASKKESIADLVSGIASTGLDASSGQLSVDVSDFMANGADNYIVTATGTDAMNAEANLTFDGTDLKIASTGKLILGGGTHTYIHESAADTIQVSTGGEIALTMGTDLFVFGSSSAAVTAGFKQTTATFNATTTTVNFYTSGNKHYLVFDGDNIATINFRMPAMSGNFTLILKQDGTGSRTVTNWHVLESDGTTADGSEDVLWPGGSAPTLSTGANDVDILSFYWDYDNGFLYGNAALDFS